MCQRPGRAAVVGCMFAALVCLSAQEPTPESPKTPLESLVQQLGHEDFSQREAASRSLTAIGEPALAILRRAAAMDPDLEIRKRSKHVSRAILQSISKSKSTLMQLAAIDEGTFEMGSPVNEPNRRTDEAPHKVRITKAFLIGIYEVTQDEYEQVMNTRPSWFSGTGGGADKLVPLGLVTNQFPVEQVSWYDAIEFCNRLSKLDGHSPRYLIENAQREGNLVRSAKVTWLSGNGYHLPTEAQWEFACRSGTTKAFHFGDANTGKSANYRPGPPTGYGTTQSWAALNRTAKVGSYPPNLSGLFDMHGNVAEWCGDWYDRDYYAISPQDDPTGPAIGDHRILRGGSWTTGESGCRSATRFYHAPYERKDYTGFRVARTPE